MLLRPSLKRKSGFTLLELAIVLGVIGVIISAIWWATSTTREAQRANDAMNQLRAVAQNMQTLMAGQQFAGPYPTDITASMITAQVIPSNYISTANPTKADNPWTSSTAALSVFTIKFVSARKFEIGFYNISRQGCINLLMQGTACQIGQNDCPAYITIAGVATLTPTTNWSTIMTSAVVDATYCSKMSYTGSNNGVVFGYTI